MRLVFTEPSAPTPPTSRRDGFPRAEFAAIFGDIKTRDSRPVDVVNAEGFRRIGLDSHINVKV